MAAWQGLRIRGHRPCRGRWTVWRVEEAQSTASAARGTRPRRPPRRDARRPRFAPGRYRFDPVPKPSAPAAQYGPMLSGRMPLTAKTGASLGRTARHALSAAGGNWSAGNIFSPSAPAPSAANASVGVATPGTQTSPCRFASRMIAVSACGITISRPPAAPTRATSSTVSTVPAPTRHAARRSSSPAYGCCRKVAGN